MKLQPLKLCGNRAHAIRRSTTQRRIAEGNRSSYMRRTMRLCRVEELFLDSKSGVFGLADSRLRDVQKLNHLYLVAAVAILYSTGHGNDSSVIRIEATS